MSVLYHYCGYVGWSIFPVMLALFVFQHVQRRRARVKLPRGLKGP